MIHDISFYFITIFIVLFLSAVIPLILKNYYITPVITFVVMLIAAFVIPNFYENTSWEPLAGYAVFLTIISAVISMGMWFYLRRLRHHKAVKNYEKDLDGAKEHIEKDKKR